MERSELLDICKRWANVQQRADAVTAIKFAVFYADAYPCGSFSMVVIWERFWKQQQAEETLAQLSKKAGN